MGRYIVIVESKAKKQLADIHKSGNKADIKRVEQIFAELATQPKHGVGKPEMLRHQLSGFWSRRINQKDRLIYKIYEDKIMVLVLAASCHY